MAIEGTLDLFQLPEILQVIAHQDKTGILTVQGEADIIAISFQDGLVVAADSLNQTLEEALGGVLASQGLVSPADFETVAAEHQNGSGRLIDLLVKREVVSREELLDAVRQHTYRLVAELLGWRVGEFKFYSGDEVSFEEGLRPLSVEELLFRSVEEASGEGSPTIPDSWSRYERVEVDEPIRVRNEGEDPSEAEGEAIWITPGESLVLEHLHLADTVSDLVVATGSDEYKVRYGLHRLLELGVARKAGPLEETPAPAPAEPVEVAPDLSPPDLAEAELDPAPVIVPELDLEASSPDLAPIPSVRRKPSAGLYQWLGRALAAAAAFGLFTVLTSTPSRLALPFPWQDAQRSQTHKELRKTLHQNIDRAAKTFHLVEGRFPERLEELVERSLVSADDLHDGQGRALAFSSDQVSYVVQSLDQGDPLASTASTEAITGDFILDPDFIQVLPDEEAQPLVLLD